jgi:hypothetical protein
VKTVFLSYRQTSDAERTRVRSFAERLRACGITVVLDQFFLDDHPAGPNDGWDKWSSDRALQTEYVIIIGSESWFQCFEKTQRPGSGLGAACEADDLRHRIYEAGGVIENIRIVLFDDAISNHIPGKLQRYHRFHAERDFHNIARWLGGTVPAVRESPKRPEPEIRCPRCRKPAFKVHSRSENEFILICEVCSATGILSRDGSQVTSFIVPGVVALVGLVAVEEYFRANPDDSIVDSIFDLTDLGDFV